MKTTGYIGTDGKYHRGEDQRMPYDVNTTYKEWSHDQGRKEFSKEIIQPWGSNGKINKAFVEAYPEISRERWGQQIMDEVLREQL